MERRQDMVGRVAGLAPQRVVLVRALALGDMLCAVPAFRALRAALPRAHLTLVGLPWARDFTARFSQYLDGFLEFPGFPGLAERLPNLGQIPTFLQTAQQMRFDLAIQLHGSGLLTNPLTAILGARQTAGFYVPGQWCPDADWFLPYPGQEPEVDRLLHLLDFLGVPSSDRSLEFPLREEDYEALRAIPQVRRLRPGSYVCVHPGASVAARRWRPEGFAVVADALAQAGLKVVLTGSLAEADLVDGISRQMNASAVNLAGRTSLGSLAVLFSGPGWSCATIRACRIWRRATCAERGDCAQFRSGALGSADKQRHRIVIHRSVAARAARTCVPSISLARRGLRPKR